MSDKDRAKKLAAARKKLKAYQTNEKCPIPSTITNEIQSISEPKIEIQQINISNKTENPTNFPQENKLQSYFENNNDTQFLSNGNNDIQPDPFEKIQTNVEPEGDRCPNVEKNENSFVYPSVAYQQQPEEISNNIIGQQHSYQINKNEQFDTIQLLIADKANLTSQIGNFQTALKEKDFQIEEINTQLINANKRIYEIESNFFDEQRKNTDYYKKIENLEKDKIDQRNLQDHLDELNKELSNEKIKINELNKIINEKNSEVELNNIRIKQISDETNITIDNRIETLTQTKFMYEQQIVDLQTMVQQLRTEKDQANQQYQNYVQHLTKDVNSLTEKKSELVEENSKLIAREKDLIDHISSLEKQIQQNIVKSETLRENQQNIPTPKIEELVRELNELKEKNDKLEKIKVESDSMLARQKEDIKESQRAIQDKANKIVDLEERIEHILSERPNDVKLLASIESDKIAASRAMQQNAELRKQLDEVQLKLIELTNDKMDLTTTLDSERHANKEMRITYDELSEQVKTLNDKLFFKDEEMIRLIHENNDLNIRYVNLRKHSDDHSSQDHSVHDHSTHDHEHNEDIKDGKNLPTNTNMESIENGFEIIEPEKGSCDGPDHNEVHIHDHGNHHHDHGNNHQDHSHNHDHANNHHEHSHHDLDHNKHIKKHSIPTTEAMQRLEERFKKLISEVADLTDEKQRLEHLVLQLQGETETIGEYIALYQTQRRMLKQKEIEKDAQLHRLSAEREEFRESLAKLTQLINKLGLNIEIAENEYKNSNEIVNEKTLNDNVHISSGENIKEHQGSDIIVKEIYSLINELKNKDNFSLVNPIVDHCACCSGKFETI